MFCSHQNFDALLFKDCRGIKDTQESPADHVVDVRGERPQRSQRAQSLSCGNDGVVIRDLGVVGVARLPDLLPGISRQDLFRKGADLRHRPQAGNVLPDLLRHCTGEDSCVRSGIGHQFLFIEFLNDLQSLVRADPEPAGTVVLQFRQIIEQRRVPDLLLLLGLQDLRLRNAGEAPNQFLRVLPFFESILFIELRGAEIPGAFHGFPFSREAHAVLRKSSQHPVEGCLHEVPDLPLPPDHHAKHAGHDPAHAHHGLSVVLQESRQCASVLQRQRPGEIDPHQVILLGPEVGCGAQVVVSAPVLRLPDAPEDLLLRLGIDPHPLPLLAPDAGHLVHQAVDVLALPPGVGADIDGAHVLPGQQLLHDLELRLYVADHLVEEVLRQKWQRLHVPPFVFLVIFFRIAHGHQVAHTPGHDRVPALQISVLSSAVHPQHPREFLRDAGLLGDKNAFQFPSSGSSSGMNTFVASNL